MDRVQYHKHNGVDAPRLDIRDLGNTPQEALTSSSASTPGGSYTSNEQDLINNLKTRLDELESRLQALGLLQ